MLSKIKVFVATHKTYDFPEDMYAPIQVGCALKNDDFGYLKDNTSDDNISIKNASFCELTALYEMWKNQDYSSLKFIGLSHYRRYFEGKGIFFKKKNILDAKEALLLLDEYDVIVPKKRNYYVESVQSHYNNAHFSKDLEEIESLIKELFPEYIKSFESIIQGKTIHLFNMFIMKKDDFDAYMQWLFTILFELEKRIDTSMYDIYQARVYGFLSERLFNVWLEHNKFKKLELKVVNIEGENLVYKAFGLLKRKFLKR